MFFKKKTSEPGKPLHIEKLVKGLIIGGAVGSVIGLTLAPKPGKETRKLIKDTSQKTLSEGKQLLQHLEQAAQDIPLGTLGKGIRALLFGKRKK